MAEVKKFLQWEGLFLLPENILLFFSGLRRWYNYFNNTCIIFKSSWHVGGNMKEVLNPQRKTLLYIYVTYAKKKKLHQLVTSSLLL